MLKIYLNIAEISQKSLKIFGGILLLFAWFGLVISFSSCDTCTGIDGNGNTPEESVFFSANPLNGSIPNIYRTDFQGNSIETVIINGLVFSSPAMDERIAFIRRNESNVNSLYISKIDGSNLKHIVSDNDIFSISYPILSPNGKNLAFNAGNSRLFYYDVTASSPTFNQITGRLTSGSTASFSNDSRYLAFIEGDGSQIPYTLKVIDATSTDVVNVKYSKVLGNIQFAGNNEIFFNWSKDSKNIIFTIQHSNNDEINIINIESGEERVITIPNAEVGGKHAAMSPKNDFLAVSGRDGNIWLIFIATNDFRFSNLTNTNGFEKNHNPKWSADGSKVIYNSSTIFDADIFSTLICSELKFETTLASVKRAYILSSNAFRGFWNMTESSL